MSIRNPLTPLIFLAAALFVAALYFVPSYFQRPKEAKAFRQTRVILPQDVYGEEEEEERSGVEEQRAREDTVAAKAALQEGETVVAALTVDFDGDQRDEQLLVYRDQSRGEGPVAVVYIAYDPQAGGYRRMWTEPVLAERPGTVSLYAQDLVGDHGFCVLVSGMTAGGEHTLTVFRKNGAGEAPDPEDPPFTKIAELRIDGSIEVQETERGLAYQQGQAPGASLAITAYGRDAASSNIMDQVEIAYAYDTQTGLYEEKKITRIPGVQIEQQRVRELLSGRSGVFEKFIAGLWYYVGPQGAADTRQYIYFDPANRELIFYSDEIQQVFQWQHSSSTRLGLYIASQNISVTTLKRFLNIELESLESVRVKVSEDVRLKIHISDSWDGSYRKIGSVFGVEKKTAEAAAPYLDAVYNGSIGRIRFSQGGTYDLYADGSGRQGKYVFFRLEDRELLELRPGMSGGLARETYLVSREDGDLTLRRVRLGAQGIEEAHEAAISLAKERSES